MATRATISLKHEDGTYSTVYNNYDGYYGSLGKELLKHFSTKEDVENLISKGDIREIHNGLVDYFNDGSVCVNTQNVVDFRNYIIKCGYDYNYLFEDGSWHNLNLKDLRTKY